jgi:hypothetical protein
MSSFEEQVGVSKIFFNENILNSYLSIAAQLNAINVSPANKASGAKGRLLLKAQQKPKATVVKNKIPPISERLKGIISYLQTF